MPKQVKRVFVEKKSGFDVEANGLYAEFRQNLGIKGLTAVRLINRYDVELESESEYVLARNTIFAEPNVDDVYDEVLPSCAAGRIFAMEYLPGQYDQRADSAAQCIQMLTQKERPEVATAKVVILRGEISDDEFAKIKGYLINPVESREASLAKPTTLDMTTERPPDVDIIDGFISKSPADLRVLLEKMGLAMNEEDLRFCQQYFKDSEKRDPTITEIRVIDTYWSDHCRHTTFMTQVEKVAIEEGRFTLPLREAYDAYLAARDYVYGDKKKPICLMDLAVMGMKELKKCGLLDDLDESDEINACSIVVLAEVDGYPRSFVRAFLCLSSDACYR
ncbi:MAG: purL [Firmicutes bacterium]|nr:purL [Bacillota bacterium]